MRFAFTFLSYVLCASLLPLVATTHPVALSSFRSRDKSLKKHFSPSHDRGLKHHPPSRTYPTGAHALRQHHEPRGLIDLDICASADARLLADTARLLGLRALNLDTTLDLCLCLKDLNLFVTTDANVKGLVDLLGPDTVALLLRLLLNTSPNAQQCTMPSHAHRTCSKDDPCHWQCDSDWTRQGNQCVCPSPRASCPSTRPQNYKRDQDEEIKADHEKGMASGNLNPALFNRIRVLANLVVKLRENTKDDPDASDCDADAVDLLSGGVLNLLTAPVVAGLLDAVHDLLGIGTDLNATALIGSDNLLPGLILHAIVGLNDWCDNNPVLADGSNEAGSPIRIELPLDLGLLGPIGADLGLGSSTSGSGTIPVVLSDGSLNPDLLVDLNELINLVIHLRTNATNLLPSDGVVNIDLFLPLFEATAQLLNITTTGGLVSSLVNLGDCAAQLEASLDGSGLQVQPLLDQVIKIVDLALNLQTLCGDQGSTTDGGDAGDSDPYPIDGGLGGIPLIVDAGGLLQSLGLAGLGVGATVGGLGDGLTGTLNGVLGSLGLGGGVDIANPPSNTTLPQVPPSLPLSTDLVSNILIDADALLDSILDLRLGGSDLASACGSLGQHTAPEVQPLLGILTGVNDVLHASVNLGNTTDLNLGLGVLRGCLLRLEDGLGIRVNADLGNTINNLLVTIDSALGTLAGVQLGLGQCGCSRNNTLLAGLRLSVRNHRHALVDVAL
ncbi:hypothetical protein BDN72DRAFT_896792 [Pluteus cervinus]|uniref:Uncharacterized protein n=1 Tax=Pluteus cervinus TaxID=181527 RepID=A0ACD3AXA7_9AGAR|nr:hypothetical protein BDN72DRAFT_896792 [Pluteus cervinus]